MKSMTPSQWREFLLLGTRTAKVATVRENGHPHVAPQMGIPFVIAAPIFANRFLSRQATATRHDGVPMTKVIAQAAVAE